MSESKRPPSSPPKISPRGAAARVPPIPRDEPPPPSGAPLSLLYFFAVGFEQMELAHAGPSFIGWGAAHRVALLLIGLAAALFALARSGWIRWVGIAVALAQLAASLPGFPRELAALPFALAVAAPGAVFLAALIVLSSHRTGPRAAALLLGLLAVAIGGARIVAIRDLDHLRPIRFQLALGTLQHSELQDPGGLWALDDAGMRWLRAAEDTGSFIREDRGLRLSVHVSRFADLFNEPAPPGAQPPEAPPEPTPTQPKRPAPSHRERSLTAVDWARAASRLGPLARDLGPLPTGALDGGRLFATEARGGEDDALEAVHLYEDWIVSVIVRGAVPEIGQDGPLRKLVTSLRMNLPLRPQLPANVADKLREEVALILTAKGSGTGILIAAREGERWLLTNHHVVEGLAADTPDLGVAFGASNVIYSHATIEACDEKIDLCRIHLRDAESAPDKPISIRPSAGLKTGEPIFAVGYPYGVDLYELGETPAPTFNAGWFRELPKQRHAHVVLDLYVNPGDSGGPVVDPSGQLVGITRMHLPKTAQSLAISTEEAARLYPGQVRLDASLTRGEAAARTSPGPLDGGADVASRMLWLEGKPCPIIAVTVDGVYAAVADPRKVGDLVLVTLLDGSEARAEVVSRNQSGLALLLVRRSQLQAPQATIDAPTRRTSLEPEETAGAFLLAGKSATTGEPEVRTGQVVTRLGDDALLAEMGVGSLNGKGPVFDPQGGLIGIISVRIGSLALVVRPAGLDAMMEGRIVSQSSQIISDGRGTCWADIELKTFDPLDQVAGIELRAAGTLGKRPIPWWEIAARPAFQRSLLAATPIADGAWRLRGRIPDCPTPLLISFAFTDKRGAQHSWGGAIVRTQHPGWSFLGSAEPGYPTPELDEKVRAYRPPPGWSPVCDPTSPDSCVDACKYRVGAACSVAGMILYDQEQLAPGKGPVVDNLPGWYYLLKRGCESGDPQSCEDLVDVLPTDRALDLASEALAEKVCRSGNQLACLLQLPVDQRAARRPALLAQACREGTQLDCERALDKDSGISAEDRAAFEERLCEASDPKACSGLAAAFASKSDPEHARRAASWACALKDADACDLLAKLDMDRATGRIDPRGALSARVHACLLRKDTKSVACAELLRGD